MMMTHDWILLAAVTLTALFPAAAQAQDTTYTLTKQNPADMAMLVHYLHDQGLTNAAAHTYDGDAKKDNLRIRFTAALTPSQQVTLAALVAGYGATEEAATRATQPWKTTAEKYAENLYIAYCDAAMGVTNHTLRTMTEMQPALEAMPEGLGNRWSVKLLGAYAHASRVCGPDWFASAQWHPEVPVDQ